jgi:hypothetical protein
MIEGIWRRRPPDAVAPLDWVGVRCCDPTQSGRA